MAKSNLYWEASEAEQRMEQYWNEHGYDFKLTARYQSKGVYEVTKDAITDTYEVSNAITDFTQMVKDFERYWDILVKNMELRRQVLAVKLDAWRDKVLASVGGKGGVDTYRMMVDVDKIIADYFKHDPVISSK